MPEETEKRILQLCSQNLNLEPQECETVVQPSQTRHSGTEFLTDAQVEKEERVQQHDIFQLVVLK